VLWLGVNAVLCERRRAFDSATNFTSTAFLRSWDRLESVELRSWIPMGYQNSRFFLADLSRRDEQRSEEEGGGTGMRSLTLSVDFRFWRERW